MGGSGARGQHQVEQMPDESAYADGRALAHLQEASTLVRAGGRIVAILPASMRGKDLLEGWEGEWSSVFSNEFAGTGVSVAIYAASCPR